MVASVLARYNCTTYVGRLQPTKHTGLAWSKHHEVGVGAYRPRSIDSTAKLGALW